MAICDTTLDQPGGLPRLGLAVGLAQACAEETAPSGEPLKAKQDMVALDLWAQAKARQLIKVARSSTQT